MNSIPIKPIVKGDSFQLEGTLDAIITGWKIRCEIYDECGKYIKLATANSGGADEQIEITDGTNGVFLITVAKNLTTCFDKNSFIEIEAETNDSPTKIFTINKGEIIFIDERITWETP
jgi:hypothetical protein